MLKKISVYTCYFVLLFIGLYFFVEDKNLLSSLSIAVIATVLGIVVHILLNKKR